ncbi:MAG: universal stress protein [Elusimicrobiota bacterium]
MKRFPPKRILVAADLSGPSMSALEAAKTLAQLWGAALEIVYVQQPPELAPSAWIGPDATPAALPLRVAEPKRVVEARLRRAAEGFPSARLKLRTVRGWPPSALLNLATPERADLLVMGTHGYAGLDRLLTGSVAEAVIRRAGIPVLAVPDRAGVWEIARVLAPWNGRSYATRGLRWARDFAHGLNATMDVLHVQENPVSVGAGWAELQGRLTSILGPSPDWSLRARKGDARARIVDEANSGRYELVVLSAHRRPFGTDLILGSTIERVLRHTKVPVLSVPSGSARPRLARKLVVAAGARLY